MKLQLNLGKPSHVTTVPTPAVDTPHPIKAASQETEEQPPNVPITPAAKAQTRDISETLAPEHTTFLEALAEMEAIIEDEISPEVSLQQLKSASVTLKRMLNATPELALMLSSEDIGALANQLRRIVDDSIMVKAESKAAPRKPRAKAAKPQFLPGQDISEDAILF